MRYLPLIVLFLASGAHAAVKAPEFAERFYCLGNRDGSVTMRLQVADTQEKQAHGLMFRTTLKPFDGMIFEFGREHYSRMWMKNTYLPLDMLFIDKDGKVVQVIEDTVPLSEAVISSEQAITTVIELEAGRAEKEGITEGTTLVGGPCPARGGDG